MDRAEFTIPGCGYVSFLISGPSSSAVQTRLTSAQIASAANTF